MNAVQKPNLSTWTQRRSHADQVVDELNALLGRARSLEQG
jgi:hypothetical protein